MRVPKQFFFKVKNLAPHNDESMDNYFRFNAATEENNDGENSNVNRKRLNSGTGHPLVPRLNLPRPDPNEEWREIMA